MMRSFIKLAMAIAVACALSVQARAAYMFDHPISIAIDNQDNLIIAETGRDRVDKYDNVLNRVWRSGSLVPQRLAVDNNGDIYVGNYGGGVKKISGANGQFLQLGPALSQVANPVAVAIDHNNFIYVLSGHSGLMQKFSPDGVQQLGDWGGTFGSGDGEFSNPTDIAVGFGGLSVFVADSGNHRIQKWELTSDTSGRVIGATFVGWMGRCNNLGRSCNLKAHASRGFSCTAKTCSPPSPGSGAGQFIFPSGLAVAAPDYVYVADYGNSRVEKFDGSGTYLGQFGTNGIGSGQLIEPSDVAADSHGNVWVSDGAAGRLVKFDSSGFPLQIFGGRELMAAVPGSPPLNVDPIFDPRAFVVYPNSSATSTVTLASFGYSGALNMTSPCCLDLVTLAPVTTAGVSAAVMAQQPFMFAPPQTPPVTANLTLSASSNPTPGKFVTQVTVADPAQNFSDTLNVGFEVLPPWPGDGPPPACMPGLQVLPLSMLDLFAWRQPMMTTPSIFTSGVGIKSTDPHCAPTGECAGFDLNLTGSPGFSPNLTMITFKNSTHSGFVKVTSSNSANCAASSTFTIPAGFTLPVLFVKGTTTTLIFSDASGNTPVAKAQFSEGPFWTFFGGRNATINFIGDWRF